MPTASFRRENRLPSEALNPPLNGQDYLLWKTAVRIQSLMQCALFN